MKLHSTMFFTEVILLTAAIPWTLPQIFGQETAASIASPATATSPAVAPRGADARAAFKELSRHGMPAVVLGSRRSPLVPSEMRFKSVDGRKLIEAVAGLAGYRVAWLNVGRTAIIQRGAADSEVKHIIEGLKSADPAVRRESAWLAGWVEDVRVVEALADSCRDTDAETGRLAVKSLIRLDLGAVALIQGEKASELLEKLAEDADINVRRSATIALGQAGGQKAIVLLEKLAADADASIRGNTAIALGYVGGQKAIALLEKLAEDKDVFVRRNAIITMGQLGSEKALALLLKLMEEKDVSVSMSAIAALGQVGGDKAFALLEKLAEAESDYIRKEAAGALGQVGGQKALVLLEKLLDDMDSGEVRWSAITSLGQVGGDKALVLLGELAGHQGEIFRYHTAAALGQMGDEKALALLEKLTKDGKKLVRERAVDALGQMGGEKASALLEKLSESTDMSVRMHAASAMELAGSEKALELLEKLAGDKDASVRMGVASALGQVGGRKVLASLAKLAGDADQNVRIRAINALGQVGGQKALELLEKLATDGKTAGYIRMPAASALGEVGGQRALELLEKLAADADAGVRWRAVGALGQIGGEKSLAILERLIGSPYEDVRKWVGERIHAIPLNRSFSLVMRTATGMLGSMDQSLQKQLADHIRRLEDEDFKVREQASQAIEKSFAAAEPLLRKALESSGIDAETRGRIGDLMKQKELTLRAMKFVRDNKLLDDVGYLKELLKSAEVEDRPRVERRLREIEANPVTAPTGR